MINNNVILNILLLLLIIYLLYCISFREDFTNYTRCDKKPVRGIMKKIFDQFNINKNKEDWDLYIPCGYNGVEKELREVNTKDTQKIFGISGCDKIVSKNSLWEVIINKYGRNEAKNIMPETFLLHQKNDMDQLKKQYKNGDTVILKKNLQRKLGIKFAQDWDTIVKSKNNDFRLAQKFISDVFIINKRKMNLRIYMLVVCKNNKKEVYFHKLGKCLYTSKDVSEKKEIVFE